MPIDSSISLKDPKDQRNFFPEVSDAEKQLWARIHSKGVLDNDVKDLYQKACCIYEKLFLSDKKLPELQNIEYLLWRLHYKHIDEFRRRISQSSANYEDKLSTNQKTVVSRMNTLDTHMEGFKSFLSEASKFYQDLIRKIKRYYGLFDEPWFYKNDGASGHIEQKKLRKCQFVCHRLCICLGDLARYLELYEKPDNQQRNWSVAASYYLEAAKIYPDGGNPQNQLAVLATYTGDDFLALYHCIRSWAVKEPFPDALQNLMLLFERNTSSNISSLSNEVYDFSKPSEWISCPSKTPRPGGFSNTMALKASEHDQSMLTYLWSLFIRTTSFFFLESSLDSFSCTFTSTLRDLEVLLALDVAKLGSCLESYQNMSLSKAGPYRVLHIISVLIFIIHNLTEEQEKKIMNPTNETQQSMLVKLALTVTFICMGRLVDRCLRGSPTVYFPLLPAILVFMEWLVGALDKIDDEDEKCESAMCYFFGSFVDLLNHLQENRAQVTSPDNIALWEDYELRGFIPLSHTHISLDFSSHWEEQINYKMKSEYRAHRIVRAAMKIAKRCRDNTRKWLFYDEARKNFSTVGPKEPVEEEEDIVFKPIARHNSEPIHVKGQPIPSVSDERLRRASSLLIAQNQASTSEQLEQNEPRLKGSRPSTSPEGPIAAGPPSLSSWIINGERLSSERAKSNDVCRSVLTPIEEMSSGIASVGTYPPVYCVPAPSVPLLPENALWLSGTSASCGSSNSSDADLAGPSVPSFIDQSPPFLAPTYSHPWVRPQFPNLGNQHLQRAHDHGTKDQCFTPRDLDGVYGLEGSSSDPLNGWSYNHPLASSPPLFHPSSSLLRGLYGQKRDILRHDYQRPSPLVCLATTDKRLEPQSLLQYLRQREWQLQHETQFTGSPYMQN